VIGKKGNVDVDWPTAAVLIALILGVIAVASTYLVRPKK